MIRVPEHVEGVCEGLPIYLGDSLKRLCACPYGAIWYSVTNLGGNDGLMSCPLCDGDLPNDCPVCGGYGEKKDVKIEYGEYSWHVNIECPACSGSGHPCPDCNGDGVVPDNKKGMEVGGVTLSYWHVFLLSALPNCEIAPCGKHDPVAFRFTGGIGYVYPMPMRKKGE